MKAWIAEAWAAFLDTLADPRWLGENLVVFAIFTVCLYLLGAAVEWLRTRRFRGWTLVVIASRDDGQPEEIRETLSARDVENYQQSSVEQWRFVKGYVGNFGHVHVRGIDEALARRWLTIERGHWWGGRGRYLIDITKIPEKDFRPHGEGRRMP